MYIKINIKDMKKVIKRYMKKNKNRIGKYLSNK